MERENFPIDNNFTEDSITPELVRGLSLGKLTESYGTYGLYTRTIETLNREGFGDNDLVQLSLQLGLTLHADDERTNGHYTDHLMRVVLHLIETLGIRDPDIIAAGPLHEVFEDHPRELVYTLTGEMPNTIAEARKLGRKALEQITNSQVVSLVEAVTNPIAAPGQNKIEVYTEHTTNLVKNNPKGRVIKVADFIENACGNHATIGEKQQKLDIKYIRQYKTHMTGLFMPDSLVVGKERQKALMLLSRGHARALGRLALMNRKQLSLPSYL